MKHSVMYALTYEKFGGKLTETQATLIARDHGCELEDLQGEGLTVSASGVSTLSLFETLGY